MNGVRFDAPHNYNRESREAVYAWMARWLQGAPADVRRAERNFTPDPLPDALVFHNRPLPAGAVTPEKLTENWIAAAKAQLSAANQQTVQRALLHALEYADDTAKPVEKAPCPRAAHGIARQSRCRSWKRCSNAIALPSAR